MLKISRTFTTFLLGMVLSVAISADESFVKVDKVVLPGLPIELTDPPSIDVPIPSASSEPVAQASLVPSPSPQTSQQDGRYQGQYPKELVIIPGVNEIIPIARGYANRIVTPYWRPKVRSANKIEVTYDANVAYVTTDSSKPVGLFITPDGVEGAEAISLTLLPKAIPPREIRLKLAGGNAGFANMQAKKWETAQSYVDTFKSLFKTIAMGDIPKGYTFSEQAGGVWTCNQQGLNTEVKQILNGHHIRVLILVAENTTRHQLEVDEASCYKSGFLAGTAWPRPKLEAGEKTELYIATRKHMPVEKQRKRPALVEGF